MKYTLLDAASDLDQFNAQARNGFESAYDAFINSLPDEGNISDYEYNQAAEQFERDIQQSISDSINQIKNSANVKENQAANKYWDSVGDMATAFVKEACPLCVAIANAEPIAQNKQEYLDSGLNAELIDWAKGANFSFGGGFSPASELPMVASSGKTGIFVAAKLAVQTAGVWVVENWNDIKSGAAVIKGWFSDLYTSAQQFLRTVFADPLVLDLDGDGIETLSVKSGIPIYFDFNSDGTKTNTGWISPDDAYLVFDRNDNGVIDDASELFSDYTPLYAGGRASDGFVALAQEDTNADGVVNHLDANWNHLKIWQDINSDGITQENELRTMEEAGIIGINTARADTSQTFANGNAIRGTGTYMKADGTIGDMGDAYYAVDTVNQQFTNPIPISPEVEALPNVQGMGLVRDLRQAAELSPVLQYLLTQYSQASTRQEQMAIIDQLLYAWADTSGMAETMASVNDEYLQEAA